MDRDEAELIVVLDELLALQEPFAVSFRSRVLPRDASAQLGPRLAGVAYGEVVELCDVLHTRALNDYGFQRYIPPDFLYHPSVLWEG